MARAKSDDRYSTEETQRRAEAALRAAFAAPHRPQSEMKLGKRRAKKANPRRRPASSSER